MNLSQHAYDRVHERLGWSPTTFEEWVQTTECEWAKFSAEYFQAHGVRVVGKDHNETLYRCPLSESRALCLVVADHTLVTIIPFDLLPGEGLTFREPTVKIRTAQKPAKPVLPKSVKRLQQDIRKVQELMGKLRSEIGKVHQLAAGTKSITSTLVDVLGKMEGLDVGTALGTLDE